MKICVKRTKTVGDRIETTEISCEYLEPKKEQPQTDKFLKLAGRLIFCLTKPPDYEDLASVIEVKDGQD